MSEKSNFNPYAMAYEYAESLGLKRGENESDDAFKSRVAGVLREKGSIIQAHEAFSGRRYDDPDQGPTGPMAGIFGALAQTMQGRKYSPNDAERQIGDDITAGVLVQRGEDPVKSALAAIFDALGPAAGMDLLDAFKSGEKTEPKN